jgi:hypothetical protein
MGIDYEIQISLPAVKLRQAIVAISEFSGELGEVSTIRFPDGQTLAVPFTSDFKPARLHVTTERKIDLDTSMLFPVTDEAIKKYADESDPRMRIPSSATGARLRVGYIYLSVELGRQYALLSFRAATSGMSRLFEKSSSIWRRFHDLSNVFSGSVPVLMRDDKDDFLLLPLNGLPKLADFLSCEQRPDERGEALLSNRTLKDWLLNGPRTDGLEFPARDQSEMRKLDL